eukprot:g17107.t1
MIQAIAAFSGGLWVQNKLSDLQLPQLSRRINEAETFKLSVQVVAASIPGLSDSGLLTRERPRVSALLNGFNETLTFAVTVADVLAGQTVQLWIHTYSDVRFGPFQVNLTRARDVGVCSVELQKQVLPECVASEESGDSTRHQVDTTPRRKACERTEARSPPWAGRRRIRFPLDLSVKRGTYSWETPVLPFPLTHVGGAGGAGDFVLGQAAGHLLVKFSMNADPQAMLLRRDRASRPLVERVADPFRQIIAAPVRWVETATEFAKCDGDELYCGVGRGYREADSPLGPPVLSDLPAEGWVKHQGPDGREFWHHTSLGPPPWDRPRMPERVVSINGCVAGTEEDAVLRLPSKEKEGTHVFKLDLNKGAEATGSQPLARRSSRSLESITAAAPAGMQLARTSSPLEVPAGRWAQPNPVRARAPTELRGRMATELLGVAKDATQLELSRAFQVKGLEAHPDRGGSAQRFDRIFQAFDQLSAAAAAPAAAGPVTASPAVTASATVVGRAKMEAEAHRLLKLLSREQRHLALSRHFSQKQRLLLEKWMVEAAPQAAPQETPKAAAKARPGGLTPSALGGCFVGSEASKRSVQALRWLPNQMRWGKAKEESYRGKMDMQTISLITRPCDLATALQYLAILVAAKHRGRCDRSGASLEALEPLLRSTAEEHQQSLESLGLRFSLLLRHDYWFGPRHTLSTHGLESLAMAEDAKRWRQRSYKMHLKSRILNALRKHLAVWQRRLDHWGERHMMRRAVLKSQAVRRRLRQRRPPRRPRRQRATPEAEAVRLTRPKSSLFGCVLSSSSQSVPSTVPLRQPGAPQAQAPASQQSLSQQQAPQQVQQQRPQQVQQPSQQVQQTSQQVQQPAPQQEQQAQQPQQARQQAQQASQQVQQQTPQMVSRQPQQAPQALMQTAPAGYPSAFSSQSGTGSQSLQLYRMLTPPPTESQLPRASGHAPVMRQPTMPVIPTQKPPVAHVARELGGNERKLRRRSAPPLRRGAPPLRCSGGFTCMGFKLDATRCSWLSGSGGRVPGVCVLEMALSTGPGGLGPCAAPLRVAPSRHGFEAVAAPEGRAASRQTSLRPALVPALALPVLAATGRRAARVGRRSWAKGRNLVGTNTKETSNALPEDKRTAADVILPSRISILGSTGSIGTQTLDICRQFPGRFKPVALAAGRNIELLLEQIKEFKPQIVACDESKLDELKEGVKALGIPDYEPVLLSGPEGQIEVARHPDRPEA